MAQSKKANLFRGQPLPLGALTPDAFEDFVYGTFCEILPLHGFKIVAGPLNSGDGGFDATGERISDRAILSVQCKRLNSTLGLPLVAVELAKVALDAALNNSDVRGHLIVTSGTVTNDLRAAQRERDRKRIIDAACEQVKSNEDLKVRRDQCVKAGLDPQTLVEKYVKGLEFFETWTAREFEVQMERVSSKVMPLIEAAFSVETVLREEPRPDFDRSVYLKKVADETSHVVELMAVRSEELPPNIRRFSTGDPTAEMRELAPPVTSGSVVDNVTSVLRGSTVGWAQIICGPGGSGKTTTLKYLGSVLAANCDADVDAPLPVFLHMGGYNGSLQELVHQSLNISRGNWKSLSGSFLLLCDGVDEIPGGRTAAFFSELRQLLVNHPVRAIISMRATGLRQIVSCDRLHGSWRLLPFTVRSALVVAERLIADERRRSEFKKLFLERLTQIDPDILLLPFGFTSAVSSFEKTGTIPNSTAELVESVVVSRLEHNRSRDSALEERLREIPNTTVRRLGEEICFELRVVRQKSLVKEDEGLAVVSAAFRRLKNAGAFGVDGNNESDALKLARHYEILQAVPGGLMRAGHDLVADYLAAPLLAKEWQRHEGHLQSTIAEDAWVFAGKAVAENDKSAYINAVASADLTLATRCVSDMGALSVSEIEKRIFEMDDRKTTYSSGIAAMAMSILRTPSVLNRLRARLAEPQGDRTYQAERALAVIGDRKVLRTILENEDASASTGLKISGGHIAIWEESGAPVVTLELARERVYTAANTGEERICLSLRTIARYGDNSDIPALEKIAFQTSHLPTFYDTIYCIRALDEDKSIAILRRIASDEKRGLQLIALEALSAYGERLDTTGLVKALLEFKGNRGEAHDNIRRVHRIIKDNDFPAGAEALLVSAYETANDDLKGDIWQIANAHSLASFNELAFKILDEGRTEEFGYAANYSKVRFRDGADKERFCGVCEKRLPGLENEVVSVGWHLRRIYEYLLEVGEKEIVAGSVDRVLRRYLPEHHRLNQEKDQNPRDYFNGVHDPKVLQYEFFVEHELKEFVSTAAEVDEWISLDAIRLLVGFRLWHGGKEDSEPFAKLMNRLSSDELDLALSAISNSYDRICALGAVAQLGSTRIRREIFIRDFPLVLHWHIAYGPIAASLPVFWCDEVARAVVDGVVGAQWPRDIGAQMFTNVKVAVTRLMSRKLAEEIVEPRLSQCKDAASREILQYWYEAALAKRHS